VNTKKRAKLVSISIKAEYHFPAHLQERMISVLLDEEVQGFVEGTDQLVDEIDEAGGILTCYFENLAEEQKVQRALTRSLAECEGSPELEAILSDVQEEQWQTAWQEHWKPTRISSSLVVAPSWVNYEKEGEEQVILIDPKMAFGTGTHETTRLCLEWLEELVSDSQQQSLLDVGCGSGVLAIGAKMFGAADAQGVDISPEAVEASILNAEINKVVGIGFSSKSLSEIGTQFDLVVANILSSVLLELWEPLIACVKPQGQLLISGLLSEEVEGFSSSVGLKPQEVREQGQWAAILFSSF
jgi:ribosomal protein L11 methyltransferase